MESVHSTYFGGGNAAWRPTIDYFTAGNVRFQLLDYSGSQQNVRVSYVLKLEGWCRGLEAGTVRVNDCWYECLKGDMAPSTTRAGGY